MPMEAPGAVAGATFCEGCPHTGGRGKTHGRACPAGLPHRVVLSIHGPHASGALLGPPAEPRAPTLALGLPRPRHRERHGLRRLRPGALSALRRMSRWRAQDRWYAAKLSAFMPAGRIAVMRSRSRSSTDRDTRSPRSWGVSHRSSSTGQTTSPPCMRRWRTRCRWSRSSLRQLLIDVDLASRGGDPLSERQAPPAVSR